jgi:hypothetical protein
MPKYEVNYWETWAFHVSREVEAEDEQEAKQKVINKFIEGEDEIKFMDGCLMDNGVDGVEEVE